MLEGEECHRKGKSKERRENRRGVGGVGEGWSEEEREPVWLRGVWERRRTGCPGRTMRHQ